MYQDIFNRSVFKNLLTNRLAERHERSRKRFNLSPNFANYGTVSITDPRNPLVPGRFINEIILFRDDANNNIVTLVWNGTNWIG